MVVQGRIKEGTLCTIDFGYFRWPHVPERLQQAGFSPDMKFTIEQNGEVVECWANGYGGGIFSRPGKYGNGSILIRNPDNIVKIK